MKILNSRSVWLNWKVILYLKQKQKTSWLDLPYSENRNKKVVQSGVHRESLSISFKLHRRMLRYPNK